MNICAFLRLLYHPWHIFTSQIYSVASSHFSFERNSSMCYESAWKVVLGLFSQLGLCRIHDFLRAWIVYAVGYLSYVNPELPPRLYCPTSKHRGLKKTPLFPILQLDWLKKKWYRFQQSSISNHGFERGSHGIRFIITHNYPEIRCSEQS